MSTKKTLLRLIVLLAITAATVLVMTVPAAAQKEKVLHSFQTFPPNSFSPFAGLISDAAGNLYTTTSSGGIHDRGTVFELTRTVDGGLTGKVIYSFRKNGVDGYEPFFGLILDTAGDLYGTTYLGGANGAGAAFELVPRAGGGWTENILHSFSNSGEDGAYPFAGLVSDVAGNLYGTTTLGGVSGAGTVFELSPPQGSGSWTEKILHSFNSNGHDGINPQGGLILDAAGNLYGTAVGGGADGYGMVFELVPTTPGNWTERSLHSFTGTGLLGGVLSALVLDAAGNLYGMREYGGDGACSYYGYVGCGSVFELKPTAGGGWEEEVIHNFQANGEDGVFPYAGLVFDAAGNLWGATTDGGAYGTGGTYGAGTIIELKPKVGGGWAEKVIFRFNGTDGLGPYGNLIFDAAGNLYGTTDEGGTYGSGTVFEITP
jgi:uncharacterized repeat protein (TIGR03803 family)